MGKRILIFLLWGLLFQAPGFSVKPALAVSQIYDMATSTNWNLRFDGAGAGDKMAQETLLMEDIDGDGKQDIIVGSFLADNNSRTDSGSIYVIYHTLLEKYSGTGNTIDLNNPANYNLRFDGAEVDARLVVFGLTVTDLNNDGRKDLMMASAQADNNSRSNSGSTYLIYHSLLDNYSGTGNNIDLANPANYNLRYDGAAAGDYTIGRSIGDFDNDGKQDLVLMAYKADNNSRSDSGSVYLIYNFMLDGYTGTGNTVDLNNPANYNLRYDGAAAGDTSFFPLASADINSNGKQDFVFLAMVADNNSRSNSGSIYLIYDSLIDDYSGTGNNIDLANSANYNLRYDGAGAGDYLGMENSIIAGDLNSNGRKDLFLASVFADNNSRSNSGSIYLIYDSLIDDYSGTGNNIDLANSTSYNLRFDGENVGELLGDMGTRSVDVDGDGKEDLLTGPPEIYVEPQRGKVYVIYNNLLDGYSGTGNNIDLANSSNYSLKFIGPASGHLTVYTFNLVDFNNDGSNDFIFTAHWSDFNSRNDSGSFYVIYNFPHTLSLNSFSTISNDTHFKAGGNIAVSADSVTSLSGMEYQVDSGSWTACTADDQSFNSTNEDFTCDQTVPLKEGAHTVNLRAYDTNTSYSAGSNYKHLDLVTDLTAPTISELAISGVSLVTPGGKYTLDSKQPNQRTPSFSGKALDTYQGYSQTNNDGIKESYLKVSSGPDKLILTLKKLKDGENPNSTNPVYQDHLTKEYSLTDIMDDGTLTEKYTRFFITTPYPLIDGYYQANLSLKDKAGNTYDQPVFYLSLNYSSYTNLPVGLLRPASRQGGREASEAGATNNEQEQLETGEEDSLSTEEEISPTPSEAVKEIIPTPQTRGISSLFTQKFPFLRLTALAVFITLFLVIIKKQ